jgi:putative spermidine/putrescine transport system permease protein
MLWLGVAYLGALAALFVTALWSQNSFTGLIERTWNLDSFRTLFTLDVYRTIAVRTIAVAALVTVIDAVVAFPIALYMSKVARPGLRRFLLVAVLMPLWASYLVKAYAWRGMFSERVGWCRRPPRSSDSTHPGSD